MATTIAVAGATGFLGGRIVKALIERGADVRALVRDNAPSDKLAGLESLGAKVAKVDLSNGPAAARALAGASCIVSTIQGLRDAIVDAQSALLEAAIAAGVPRFIPSDYSVDFTKLEAGENRNFDLRREFHDRLDKASIRSTSILSGANMELLTRAMPLLDLKSNRVTYWGKDPDQRLDFTTTGDTAAFTAAAALDPDTPNILRIAGDQISARELAVLAGEVGGDVRARLPGQPRSTRRIHPWRTGCPSRKRERAFPEMAANSIYAQHVQRPRQAHTARQRPLPRSSLDESAGLALGSLNPETTRRTAGANAAPWEGGRPRPPFRQSQTPRLRRGKWRARTPALPGYQAGTSISASAVLVLEVIA